MKMLIEMENDALITHYIAVMDELTVRQLVVKARKERSAVAHQIAEDRKSRGVKLCRKCRIEKPLSEFWRHVEAADGYMNACKRCDSPRRVAAATAWNRAHPERVRANSRAHYLRRKAAREAGTDD